MNDSSSDSENSDDESLEITTVNREKNNSRVISQYKESPFLASRDTFYNSNNKNKRKRNGGEVNCYESTSRTNHEANKRIALPQSSNDLIHVEDPTKLNTFIPTGSNNNDRWEYMCLVAKDNVRVDRGSKLRYADAKCGFCRLCNCLVPFSENSHNNIARHPERRHKEEIKSLKDKKRKEAESKSNGTDIDHYSSEEVRRTLEKCSKEEQVLGETIVVRWFAESLRPFSMAEDPGFRRYTDYCCQLESRLDDISRRKLVRRMEIYDSIMRLKMREIIQELIDYFAMTSDVWSSKKMDSFMALTLHALTPEFEQIIFTLAVENLHERHTGEHLKDVTEALLVKWGISKEKLTLMLRDNAANAKKACELMEIDDFPCLGHCLHLILGPLFFHNNKKKSGADNVTNTSDTADIDDNFSPGEKVKDDDIDEDDIMDFNEDDIENELTQLGSDYEDIVKHIMKKVRDVRTINHYIRYSTVARGRFKKIQDSLGPARAKNVQKDVRTRWNATLSMIENLISLKPAINNFLQFMNDRSQNKVDYPEKKPKKLPDLLEDDWCLFEGLCVLLQPFKDATELLSGENYHSFVFSLPIIRKLQSYLQSQSMYSYKSNATPEIKEWYKKYQVSARNFNKIVRTLDELRKGILESFDKRFRNIHDNYIWTTVLDPRLRRMNDFTTPEERKRIFKKLRKEVETLIREEEKHKLPTLTCTREITPTRSTLFNSIYDEPYTQSYHDKSANVSPSTRARQEVEEYLNTEKFHVAPDENILIWWKDHRNTWPHIAKLARKWLAVPASSTSSERVFSDCGICLPAKRSNLSPEHLEMQIMIRRNGKYVNITENELVRIFMNKDENEGGNDK